MPRHTIARATLVAGLVIGTIAPLGGTAGAAEPAPLPAHTVIPSERTAPRHVELLNAGTHGFWRTEEQNGILWTSYADGRTVKTQQSDGQWFRNGSGSDLVVVDAGGAIELRNPIDGTTRKFTVPDGQHYVGTYGETIVTAAYTLGSSDPQRTLYLNRVAADGSTTTRRVEGDVVDVSLHYSPVGDTRTVIVRVKNDAGVTQLGLLDIETARVTDGPAVNPSVLGLGEQWLVWLAADGKQINAVPRDTPLATPITVPWSGDPRTTRLAVVGDWVLVTGLAQDGVTGVGLKAVPLRGGDPVTLLDRASLSMAQVPGGDVLAIGGTDASHWAVRRVTAPADGTAPVLTKVADIPPAATVKQLSLANGTLATLELRNQNNGLHYYARPVTTDGAQLTSGASQTLSYTEGHGQGPIAAGDGGIYGTNPGRGHTSIGSIASAPVGATFSVPSLDARVKEITGRYAVVDDPAGGKQYIGDFDELVAERTVIRTRAITPTTVWGRTAWTPSATAGILNSENLLTGVRSTLNTGAPCVPKELQAVGRWIYWNCGPTGKAGVWDNTAKKNIPVPSGEALIGDGFLVRHDKAAGKLLLTEFRDGVADTTQTVGDLPATTAPQRGVTWTVDRFGGPVAYAAADGTIHLAPSGVPTEPLVIVDSAQTTEYRRGLRTQFRLSRPASAWQIQFKEVRTGRVVHTLSGNAQNGLIQAAWDGKTADGYATNGAYTYVLTAQPANGQGPVLTRSGSFTLDTGAPVWRDHSATSTAASMSLTVDGRPDLLSLGSGGDIAVHAANGTGGYSRTTSVAGWPTNTLVVPMGDMDGNRCNDFLIRVGSELRRHHGWCHGYVNPKHPYTSLGTAWGQFNVLTSPGDLTGDGRPDLVARQATTGDIYLYADNGAGGLKARGRIGTNWKAYRAIVGAGDLNGDGIGDLLAVDGANSLWRYDGTATGTVKPRVLVFGNSWASGRNAFVGAGDITGDGRPDLVTRNSAGDLLRNNGNGRGSFGSTVKIGAGWQAKLRLF
ncbi:VCBS repeat-containing protein [Streptomyces coeruleoprunus]|uniref:VCBS repeat-containing protein n=1 Tax=Streptomyces coeruleoprunus TaxID=285563 RepID=A0ABV9XCR6_9ACTN